MKYDNSMTQFRDVIIVNLRRMCNRDKAIIEQYCAENAAPAQLQDFLKSNCGNSGCVAISEGVHFWCSKSNGMKIDLSYPVRTDGDRTLTLSWSQVAKFIRNNREAIFRKSEPEKTVEPDPINADISVLNLMVNPYNTLKRMGINTVAELEARTDDVRDRLPKDYPLIFKAVEEYRGKPITSSGNEFAADENAVDNTTEPAEKKQELIPAPAEEPPAVFNYSELDSDRAKKIASSFNYALLTAEMGDFLKRKEQQLKNEYMNFTANCGQIFAEAQEKLAGNNRYNGFFEKWIEYMGFAKKTVYRMIDVYKFYSCQIDTSKQEIFNELPKMLQYDISAKSAPPELVEQVMNGDITTHKDYIALKKQLEDAQKQAENAEMQSQTYQQNYLQMSKNFDEACEENTNLDERIKELENRQKEMWKENTDLQIKLKEAESRPHDTVVDVEEVNRRVAEAAAKFQNQTAQQIAEDRKTYSEKIDRMQSTIDELENELAETKTYSNTKLFAIRISPDDLAELQKIVSSCKNAAIKNAIKNVQIIKID